MSSIQEIWTSRVNQTAQQDAATGNIGNTFVGQDGRLWYNPDTNAVYVYGDVAGGVPVGLDPNANVAFDTLRVANLLVDIIGTDDSSVVDFRTDVRFIQGATIDVGLDVVGSVSIDGNLAITGNIPAATTIRIGGVRAGPGANISNTGLLTIDTTGLPLSFGNFTANNNILTIVNSDENMILETEGNAEIQLIGNVGFYKENGLPPDPSNRYFRATDDGQIQIFVPNTDPLLGAVEIIGSASLETVSPAVAGVMLHITGQPAQASSIYNDGIGSNPNYIGRRYNGNAVAPTQVLAGQSIVRFSGQGYSTGGFDPPADGTISLDALENFTATNQGAIWRFLVNPVSGNVRQEVANISVANGITATRFETAGNITATGNITGGNLFGILITGTLSTAAQPNITSVGTLSSLTVTGNVSGGNLTTGAQVVATGNITGANITATTNIADSKGDVRSIPVNTQNTGYTLLATDAGKVINMTTGNVTIPAGVFASPFGQAVTIYNDQNASNAVVQGSGVTMRLAGTAATGNRTLARYGLATVVCVSANTFVISGAGLT